MIRYNTTCAILLVLAGLFSCREITTKEALRRIAESKSYSTDALPESVKPITVFSHCITHTSHKGKAHPYWFEAAFSDSTYTKMIDETEITTYTFQTVNAGKLHVESGKLIASDPITTSSSMAFQEQFPTGDFTCELAVLKSGNYPGRVAFARIKFSEQEVEKWMCATMPGERPLPANDSLANCFTVDAGLGLFADSLSLKAILQLPDKQSDMLLFPPHSVRPAFYGDISTSGKHTLFVFQTGYGDGCYNTFIGYDKHGNICRLLSDLGVLFWKGCEN